MSAIPTPENWHWHITPKQVDEIKAGNRETINRVYFDNYEKFKFVVYAFCARHRCGSMFEDFLQEIYFDLPRCNFLNSQKFYFSLIKVCYDLKYGRSVMAYSYENKDGDDEGGSLFETLRAPEEQRDSERRAQNAAALRLIELQGQLNDKQKDILTAVAFGCAVYDGIFEYAKKDAFNFSA